MLRICLDCGMEVPLCHPECPKCDARLSTQSDGSVLHLDIAHHGETVAMAMSLLQQALEEAVHAVPPSSKGYWARIAKRVENGAAIF